MQVDGMYSLEGSSIFIQNGRIVNGYGAYWDECYYTGEFHDGKATVFGGPRSSWAHTETQEWVVQETLIIVNGGKYVWKKHLPCDGVYHLDSSTVEIRNGKFIGGTGIHWNHCRYTGQFRDGRATVFGGPGSSWPHGETQEWIAQGDLMIVNGGKHMWKKHFPWDGMYRLDKSTVEIRRGKIIGGKGQHWNHCRYTGEFLDGRAIVFGGPKSSWPPTLTQSWVMQKDSVVVDGGVHVWRKM